MCYKWGVCQSCIFGTCVKGLLLVKDSQQINNFYNDIRIYNRKDDKYTRK
jgi:hypothetical protein